jgi:hypothetical protein
MQIIPCAEEDRYKLAAAYWWAVPCLSYQFRNEQTFALSCEIPQIFAKSDRYQEGKGYLFALLCHTIWLVALILAHAANAYHDSYAQTETKGLAFGQRCTTCTCLCGVQASGQEWPLIIISGYKSQVRKIHLWFPLLSFDILVCGSGSGWIRIHLSCSTLDPGRIKLTYNFDKNLSKFWKNILNSFLFCKR